MSKMISYLKEAFSELLNKVTWPSWSDLQNSSIVVAIATLIIALVIYLLDTTFSNVLDLYYSFFA
ncbi:preprotein translocase subunit SecE [Bacteroidota bacterium]|nr:preprotein translocase subunit SecE [Bacteroidota bacterium]MDC3129736.1 preprotein translocase subunit SecE [Bacteroidota bacterium]MDC3154134.1 preprotein translocase subunit SecE [Bacteroidota bacterium]RPG52807.1 MAG: preprotein translocase subunit SecE [Flavobacteriales bacterium TMED84]|tara:strand:- start:29086 stop:29280 length:195 start_codon:yes stop_codon:yes gene_type:complete